MPAKATSRRFVSLCFPHLTTDWQVRRQPGLRNAPFVLAAPERDRAVVRAASPAAEAEGITAGAVVADARAILPWLLVMHDVPGRTEKALAGLAEWCLRYTPIAAVDAPDGLVLEASGCAHLWGGEGAYLRDLSGKLRDIGYSVRYSIADTVGAAWAVARYASKQTVVECGRTRETLLSLPPAALRLEEDITARLHKLGFHRIGHFIDMPRGALRRRFGDGLLRRLDQALGLEPEEIIPVKPPQPFTERLPCPEPICTATGIEIGLTQLLQALCERLAKECKGLRSAVLTAFRVDGAVQKIGIGTVRPSRAVSHLFKLFEPKICGLEPALGFELFTLEAPVVEDVSHEQEQLWAMSESADNTRITQLLDRLAGRLGEKAIHRYLPAEHYWPERSYRCAASFEEMPTTIWRTDRPRPVHLLPTPEPIDVMVPLPDYPPVHFHYQKQLHRIAKADGPERIEGEWWLDDGEARDYYCVESEEGARYWLFRAGRYDDADATREPQWYMHGFFA